MKWQGEHVTKKFHILSSLASLRRNGTPQSMEIKYTYAPDFIASYEMTGDLMQRVKAAIERELIQELENIDKQIEQ